MKKIAFVEDSDPVKRVMTGINYTIMILQNI